MNPSLPTPTYSSNSMMGASCATSTSGDSDRRRIIGGGERCNFLVRTGIDPLEATEDEFRNAAAGGRRARIQGTASRSARDGRYGETFTLMRVCGERGFIRCGWVRIFATTKFASSIAQFAGCWWKRFACEALLFPITWIQTGNAEDFSSAIVFISAKAKSVFAAGRRSSARLSRDGQNATFCPRPPAGTTKHQRQDTHSEAASGRTDTGSESLLAIATCELSLAHHCLRIIAISK